MPRARARYVAEGCRPEIAERPFDYQQGVRPGASQLDRSHLRPQDAHQSPLDRPRLEVRFLLRQERAKTRARSRRSRAAGGSPTVNAGSRNKMLAIVGALVISC